MPLGVLLAPPQQKPTHAPVYIPQSNPIMMKPQTDQSMTELIKYLRETEGKRTAIKEKTTNELEKGKKETPDEKQVFFSTTDSQNITPTPITTPTITPIKSFDNVLPTNTKASPGPPKYVMNKYEERKHDIFTYDSLKHKADLQGGNPNTGQLSVSTSSPPIVVSQPTTILRHRSHPNNAALTDLLRSRIASTTATPDPDSPKPKPQPEPPAPQPAQLIELPGAQTIPEESKEETVSQETKDDEFFDLPEEEAPPEEAPQAAPEPEPEAPPLETTSNEPTQAQQLIGMDNTTTPTAQRPINDISPPKHLEDVVGGGGEVEKTGAEQSDEAIRLMREALSPKKAASGEAAEDTTTSSNPVKPAYTQDEISKMTVKDLGAIVEQVGITDDQGIPLVFNGSRVHRVTNTSYQLKKGEIAQYVALHYYPK